MSERANARRLGPPWVPVMALLQRELLERVRTGGHFIMRTLYVFVLFMIVLLFGAEALIGDLHSVTRAPEVGRLLFGSFSLVQYALAVLIIPLLGAGAIVDERRERSMGLLLLTELSYGQIVGGKVLARLGVVLLILLSNIPVLSLASILGGVELLDVARVFALTLGTSIMMTGVTVALSSALRSPVQVAIASYAWLAALLLSLFGLIALDPRYYWSWHPMVALALSVWEPLQLGGDVWVNAGVNAGVGVAACVAAALLLRASARRQRVMAPRVGVTGRAERPVDPGAVWSNPIAWRGWSRSGRPLVWSLLSLSVGLGCALWALLIDENDLEPLLLIGAPTVVVLFSLFAIATGSSAFAQEKREQTLDLLNLTFLTSWEIIWGKAVGVGRLALYAGLILLPGLVVGALRGPEASPLLLLLPVLASTVVIFFFGAMSIFYSLVADTPMKAAFPAVGTFIYVMGGMVFWPLIIFQDEDALGLSLILGYALVWVPVVVLVARSSSPRLGSLLGWIGGWSAGILLTNLLVALGYGSRISGASVGVGLHPGALVVASAVFGLKTYGMSVDKEFVAGALLGVPLLGLGGVIFLMAGARLMEERRRVESSEGEVAPVAALLSGVLPGAGHLFLGRNLRGGLFLGGYLLAALVVAVVAFLTHPAVGFALLLLHGVAAADAWVQGQRESARRREAALLEREGQVAAEGGP